LPGAVLRALPSRIPDPDSPRYPTGDPPPLGTPAWTTPGWCSLNCAVGAARCGAGTPATGTSVAGCSARTGGAASGVSPNRTPEPDALPSCDDVGSAGAPPI